MYGIHGPTFTLVWVCESETLEPKTIIWERKELTGTSMCEHNPAESGMRLQTPLQHTPKPRCQQNDTAS